MSPVQDSWCSQSAMDTGREGVLDEICMLLAHSLILLAQALWLRLCSFAGWRKAGKRVADNMGYNR